ncbi:hypothetical protein [Vibrio syngnathi]|uniref:Lipoprotein n=1 Tax=Vibrio syngnathi TaxID=3034029 RepID=A0AA34XQC0_9VIBR|nr:hypothetical protein [Vibrio syngnathi]ARP40306.1 hypothetical protein K08M4_36450 [Vibrio syngnathi]
MKSLLLGVSILLLSACNSNSSSSSPKPTTSTAVASVENVADKAMIKQVGEYMKLNYWDGYNYAKRPHYLIRVNAKDQPINAFIINPQSVLKGATKIGSAESGGMSIYEYKKGMYDAVTKINNGSNNLYTFDLLIDGHKYYAQKYTDAVAKNQHPFTNDLLFAPHEVFHIYQTSWANKSNWRQDVDNYPTTKSIIQDELILTELFDGLPRKLTKVEARELLKQYVAIRHRQMLNDNTSLVENMALSQERIEGSAEYITVLRAREVYKNDSLSFDKGRGTVLNLKTQKEVKWHFGFSVFYNTGASVIYLLDQLGYKIEQLEKAISPYDAALSIVGHDVDAYQRALKSVGSKVVQFEKDAIKYSSLR